jgi:glyoxylase-like metal-dependent hydrolase (beta-lactamase superfamily II)
MTATRRSSVHAFRLGRCDAWSLHDGHFFMAPPMIGRGVSPELAQRCFGAELRPDGQVELQVNVMLLRWGSELVLIDAGCGTAFGPTLGFLGARLEEIGVAPGDVTAVVFTHLHLDHVGGALDLEARRVRFPRARYLAERAEVAFWRSPQPDLSGTELPAERRQRVIDGSQNALEILGDRLEMFSAGEPLWPGFTSVPLPGHTPHHTGFLLENEGERLLNLGDALIDPRLSLRQPELAAAGDIHPEVSVRTRQQLIAQIRREHLRTFGVHYPQPGLADAIDGARRHGDEAATVPPATRCA